MSKVYFFKIEKQSPKILEEAGNKIFKVFSDFFGRDDKVLIKVHFGERGSKTYLSPVFVKAVYKNLIKKVKEAALADCTVLYKSERSFASFHKKLAKEHGFDFAPVLILDGEKGNEEIKININQRHFREVKLGAGIKNFNAILAISHFTGHGCTGFGAGIKNVGMGFGSKAGKLEMHKAFKLKINSEICRLCGVCQRECPSQAILKNNGKFEIEYQKCIGCGFCISVCPFGAVEIPWEDSISGEVQEKIVEYTLGALKGRKAFFVNVLLNITPRCDCLKGVQEPMVPDIGVLASEDIVSIEQASLDLIGKEKVEKTGIDESWQIEYAKELGLGEREYELVEIK